MSSPTERVLVTGAAGRLGRAVTADLLRAGYRVIGADRAPVEAQPDVESLVWDGEDVASLRQALDGCGALIHLAAIPDPYNDPDEVVFVNNTRATFAALQAASLAGVSRVAIASSVSAYGTAWSPEPTRPLYVPVDEDHPLVTRDPYALSKEVDERTAEMFCRGGRMSVAALRFHWIATRQDQLKRAAELRGPRDVDWDEELRELWGYVDVRDAARACRLAVETARVSPFGFAAMNICAADTVEDRPISELLEHAPGIEIRGELKPGAGAYAIQRAKEVIGWEPRFSWRDDDAPGEAVP